MAEAVQVTVIDYGLGNLFSIQRALAHLGAEVEISEKPEVIRQAKRLILPGVGAFGDGMQQLDGRQLSPAVHDAVDSGVPLLGICLGMQLLFSESEEFGRHAGLNLISGSVRRLNDADAQGSRIKVPHVGWSSLQAPAGALWDATVLEGLPDGESMYFVHSFVPFPADESVVTARMNYGGFAYAAVVERGSVVGCQFHPEKSGQAGMKLLNNFLNRQPTRVVSYQEESR